MMGRYILDYQVWLSRLSEVIIPVDLQTKTLLAFQRATKALTVELPRLIPSLNDDHSFDN